MYRDGHTHRTLAESVALDLVHRNAQALDELLCISIVARSQAAKGSLAILSIVVSWQWQCVGHTGRCQLLV